MSHFGKKEYDGVIADYKCQIGVVDSEGPCLSKLWLTHQFISDNCFSLQRKIEKITTNETRYYSFHERSLFSLILGFLIASSCSSCKRTFVSPTLSRSKSMTMSNGFVYTHLFVPFPMTLNVALKNGTLYLFFWFLTLANKFYSYWCRLVYNLLSLCSCLLHFSPLNAFTRLVCIRKSAELHVQEFFFL